MSWRSASGARPTSTCWCTSRVTPRRGPKSTARRGGETVISGRGASSHGVTACNTTLRQPPGSPVVTSCCTPSRRVTNAPPADDVSRPAPRCALRPRRGVMREVHEQVLVGRARRRTSSSSTRRCRASTASSSRRAAAVVRDLGSRNGTWSTASGWLDGHGLHRHRAGLGETRGASRSPDVEALLRATATPRDHEQRRGAGPCTSAAEARREADARAQAGPVDARVGARLEPRRGAQAAPRRAGRADCDEVLLCTRTAEGALRRGWGCPRAR